MKAVVLKRAIMRKRKRTEEDKEMNLGRERDEEVSESEEKERSQGGRAGKCKKNYCRHFLS